MQVHYLFESRWKAISGLKESLKDDYEKIINDLARRGIYKEQNGKYKIEYVGIIAFNKTILAILPKFFPHMAEERQEHELKIIMQVLKTHAKKENNSIQNNLLYSTSLNDQENTTNRLALIDDILRDYMQHGLYKSTKHMEEINGDGEINWETTINQEQAHIINNTPIYLNLHTNYMLSDNDHYITRLHKYILIKAKDELNKFPIQSILKDIMDVPNFDFTYNTDNLINEDIMNNAIDRELQNVMSERKTILLKKMKLFINQEEFYAEQSLKLWGVHKFWSVWESICKNIFKDQSNTYKIPKPYYKQQNSHHKNPVPTLIPDIITTHNNNLLILDAKYYNFSFSKDGTINGEPPKLESIIKQFSYELALQHMSNSDYSNNDHTNIHNYFCIPTYENKTALIGDLHFKIFPQLKAINIIQLSHKEVFHMYIHNKHYHPTFYKEILQIPQE